MKPEVTFCILTYNNPSGAIDLVNDIYRLHDPGTFRIISLDQTQDGIPFEHEVHLHIRSYRNLGFSKGMNTMWKLVQTPYTVLANDDVRLLSASWYEDAKAHLKDGVLGVNPFPALRTWDGGGSPRWYWEIHGEDWEWTKNKPYESYTEEDYRKLQRMLTRGCPPGTTMFFTLLKTEARDIIGLLDEAYWCGGEDYDYNRRIFLTCKNCNKRKHDHPSSADSDINPYADLCLISDFEPYKILTCTHSLVHHESSVSKGKAVAAKEANGYDLVAKNKNIFNQKWATPDCQSPDIYGRGGAIEPNNPWYIEVPL